MKGFVVGAICPIGLGLNLIVRDVVYRASLPEVENQAYCGTGMFVAWMLILFVAPICGIAGAVIGLLMRTLRKSATG